MTVPSLSVGMRSQRLEPVALQLAHEEAMEDATAVCIHIQAARGRQQGRSAARAQQVASADGIDGGTQ